MRKDTVFVEEVKTYSIYEMLMLVMVLMIFTPPITRMTTARWQTMESSTNYNFSSQMVSPISNSFLYVFFSTYLHWPENPIETNTKIWLWVCVRGIQNWVKLSISWLMANSHCFFLKSAFKQSVKGWLSTWPRRWASSCVNRFALNSWQLFWLGTYLQR